MAVTLSTDDDRALFDLVPILDSVRYRVQIRWNTRGLFWTISMAQPDGTRLFDGRAVRVRENMLGQFLDDRLPPGALVVVDSSGGDVDPDRDAFANGRCRIVYLTEEDLRNLIIAALGL